MIINGLASIFSSIFSFFFKLFTLPMIPEEIENVIYNFFDLVFENSSLLGLFISIDLLKKLCAIALVIFAFDRTFTLFKWLIKKLPFVK